ncbi:hypothetical protein NE865_12215 [Phthorimaea operculella]|nr:hypothetical protein NE865_12215 [Phthorimaea operculella]
MDKLSKQNLLPTASSAPKYPSNPDLSTALMSDDEANVNKNKRFTSQEDRLALLFERQTETMSRNFEKIRNDLDTKWKHFTQENNSNLASEFKKISETTHEVKNQLAQLESAIKTIGSSVAVIESRQSKVESEVQTISGQLRSHNDQLTKLSEHSKEVTQLKSTITQLQAELTTKDQRDRLNNIEISGVPFSRGENLNTILHTLCVKVGCALSSPDIDFIHRVRKHPGPAAASEGSSQSAVFPNIIIKFTQRRRRDEFLAACKSRCGLSTSDLGFDGPSKPIFVNEHLSPTNKALYRKTREVGKELAYQFVWIKDCKIFLRKTESSKIIHIASEKDLFKIK